MMLLAALLAIAVHAPAAAPIDDLGGDLVVKATIDGRGPFNLVLDTGAGATVLTPHVFQALRLSARGVGTASGLGTHTVQDRIVTLKSVAVGAAAAQNVAAVVVDLPPDLTYQGRYGRIDGILGYTFLKNFAVTIDYERSRAIFVRSNSDDPRRIPMALVQSVPVVHGTVAGVPASIMLDSGNNGIGIVSTAFARKAGDLTHRSCASARQTHEGVGGSVSSPLVRVPEIRVGSSVAHNIPLAVTSAPEKALAGSSAPDVILGNAFLRRFRLTVDYLHNSVTLTPTARADRYAPYFSTGLSLRRRADGTLFVQSVSANSASARAGLRTGDEILAIDEIPARQLSDADISRETGHGRIRYRIRSSGRTRDVTLILHDALPACHRID